VYFPDHDYVTTVCAYELTAMSAEARYWLLGFLTGSEPSVHEFLGRERAESPEPTEEEWARYRTFLKRSLRDGHHVNLNPRPDRAIVITDEERLEINLDDWRPWTDVGDRVLVPDGAVWVEADPQPEMDRYWLAGSVCAERGTCRSLWLESNWLVCPDCGQVTMHRDVGDD
jgi:hypothetical protein